MESRDVQEAMELGRESPAGVVKDARDGTAQVGCCKFRVYTEAGLKIHQSAHCAATEVKVAVEGLSQVNDFYLIGSVDDHGQIRNTADADLGRESNPIDIRRQRAGAVGFYGYLFACGGVEQVDEFSVNLQTRFTAGEYYPLSRIAVDFRGYLFGRHGGGSRVICVAEWTTEVAAAQSHEYRWLAGMATFPL